MILISGMHPQRTLNIFSAGQKPDYLTVFIGGFGDVLVGSLSRVEQSFPGFLPDAGHVSAYYHWDGGGLGVFLDRCGRIAEQLNAVREALPEVPVILVGHSYGGSCAVEVARRQSSGGAPLCLLTIDAVARRQKNKRPSCADWWGNAYLSEGGGLFDVVPRIGGRWGHCEEADTNLAFSGFQSDQDGCLYSHRRPGAMLYEAPEAGLSSLYAAASVWLERMIKR